MGRFVLVTSDDRMLPDPTPELVESVLRGFPADADDAFVILGPEDDDSTYMQAAGGPNGGFTLEYQAGSLEEHYECAINPLPTEHVVMALQAYLRGDEVWRRAFRWEKVEL